MKGTKRARDLLVLSIILLAGAVIGTVIIMRQQSLPIQVELMPIRQIPAPLGNYGDLAWLKGNVLAVNYEPGALDGKYTHQLWLFSLADGKI